MLGIGERTLYRKIKAWGLNVRKRGQKTSSHSLPNATP
jgi:DNA-binding NtrC family response regulator